MRQLVMIFVLSNLAAESANLVFIRARVTPVGGNDEQHHTQNG